MQVWRCTAPGGSNVSDDIVFADLLPNLDVEPREMAKPCRQTIAVIDDDEIPVRGLPLRINDFSVSGRVDLSSE